MAAQLTDEGRFPAVQMLDQNQYSRFLTACETFKPPTEGLKKLMSGDKRNK